MLSNTTRYALRAVIYLAKYSNEEKRIGIKKIAEDLTIPSPFLGKILQTLAKHKLLLSNKGPNGGFAFPSESDDVTLYDIVKIIDGDDMFTKCLLTENKCAEEGKFCTVHDQYQSIRNDLKKMFMENTIKSFVETADNEKNMVF